MKQLATILIFCLLCSTIAVGAADLKRHSVVAGGHPIAVWEKRPADSIGTIVLIHGRTWSSLPNADHAALLESVRPYFINAIVNFLERPVND